MEEIAYPELPPGYVWRGPKTSRPNQHWRNFVKAPHNPIFHYIGAYIRAKYRARVQEAGVYVVARQLRKQGISLEVARLILL